MMETNDANALKRYRFVPRIARSDLMPLVGAGLSLALT